MTVWNIPPGITWGTATEPRVDNDLPSRVKARAAVLRLSIVRDQQELAPLEKMLAAIEDSSK